MVCVCGHKLGEHDYNRDTREREKCHPRPIHISGINYQGIMCNCDGFMKTTYHSTGPGGKS